MSLWVDFDSIVDIPRVLRNPPATPSDEVNEQKMLSISFNMNIGAHSTHIV
jgi:hypothetical protein